ncbi:hypothetical protein CRN46_17195 [Vibrio vulnificus]|nr:hypothetical protein CRN46_17195 [Vibrio vulnificus]
MKAISLCLRFVTPKGLELTPFYDLVNIEAIAQEGAKRNSRSGKLSPDEGRAASIPQYFAMSIGDWESEHIELCVSLIQTECEYLLAQADSVPEMSKLL